MTGQSNMAAKVVTVFQQLREGAGSSEVDATRLLEMAERIVRDEVALESYRETWKGSPFAALGTTTGNTSGPLPTSPMTPVRAANLAAEEIEAKQPERSGDA